MIQTVQGFSGYSLKSAGTASWGASEVRGEDTEGCWGAWGCQRPLEPHPEAGASESCLLGLAMVGAGRGGTTSL